MRHDSYCESKMDVVIIDEENIEIIVNETVNDIMAEIKDKIKNKNVIETQCDVYLELPSLQFESSHMLSNFTYYGHIRQSAQNHGPYKRYTDAFLPITDHHVNMSRDWQ